MQDYQCQWEEDLRRTGYKHGYEWSLSQTSVKLEKLENDFYKTPKLTLKAKSAMDAAVLAFEKQIERDKKRTMSTNVIPFDEFKLRGKRMNQELVTQPESKSVQEHAQDFSIMEKVLLTGDLSKMEPRDRITYYMRTCNSMGLNPMTKPFDLITLNGKMVLYPNRSGTDQLRKIGNVEIAIVKQFFDKDTGCYEVTAQAKLPNGRKDEDMGIVNCAGVKGEALANAKLKAVTKAKRRVTLSIMGLGWIDESEVGSVKGAKTFKMDLDTGAVLDSTPMAPSPLPDSEPPRPQQHGAPECCEKTMIVSKFPDRASGLHPFYCMQCKRKEFPKTEPNAQGYVEISQGDFDGYQFVK